jgi:maltose O-acetyltransferase
MKFLKQFIINVILLVIGKIPKWKIDNIIFESIQRNQENKYLGYKNKYNLSNDFRFNGDDIMFYGEGEITALANSYIGSYSTIQSVKDKIVKIGHNTRISHNVRIYTESAVSDQDFSSENLLKKSGNVIIGNYVWIGANVFINPGVEIGDNSIVGSNSVVNKNIPQNSIFGGVPAKLIKMKTII